MTRKSEKAEQPQNTSILPLPELFLQHHLDTIAPALREWKAQKRIPPVLLITGLAGVGKREIVHFLSQWILCERNGFGRQGEGEPDLFGGGGLFGESVASEANQEVT